MFFHSLTLKKKNEEQHEDEEENNEEEEPLLNGSQNISNILNEQLAEFKKPVDEKCSA